MSDVAEMIERPQQTEAPDHAQADRRQLRGVLRQVLIATVGFVAMAAVWEIAGNFLHIRPEVPEPFASKIDYCLSSGDYDTAFVGSSRYFHGIDPTTFDAETAHLGVPTHSYNL